MSIRPCTSRRAPQRGGRTGGPRRWRERKWLRGAEEGFPRVSGRVWWSGSPRSWQASASPARQPPHPYAHFADQIGDRRPELSGSADGCLGETGDDGPRESVGVDGLRSDTALSVDRSVAVILEPKHVCLCV